MATITMKDWQYRLLAFILAVFVWYLVSGREKVEYWVEVPLEVVSLPEDMVIIGGLPSKIQVRVRATRTVLERLQQEKYSYRLDLSNLSVGPQVVILESRYLKLPPPVEVVSILPPRLELDVDKIMKKNVPVEVVWKTNFKDFSDYFDLKEISYNPSKVLISGPSRVIKEIDKLKTKAIEIEPLKSKIYKQNVPLELDAQIESERGSVEVYLVVVPKRKELWIVRTIQFLNPAKKKFNLLTKDKKCKLKLGIPLYLWEKNKWKEDFEIFVEIPKEKGEYELPVQLKAAQDIVVLEKDPSILKIKVE
ncbi:MAG TPA: hypothetical protein DIT19_00755 [Desulfonauticus sp.]|nr:MAG: YbbR family protein [Desulfonauticus sp. 38_4375]HCO11741.1 hypothetical protein [Desulfonauticus sp.]